MGRHIAHKTTPEDLDDDDRALLEELRRLRDAGSRAPTVIAELRGRGVDAEMIASAFGVTRGRVYQVPPAEVHAAAGS